VAEVVVVSGIANASTYPDIIMVVIVATVVIAAIGIPIFARKAPIEPPELQLPEYEEKEPLGEERNSSEE
jgi:NhaP-type Na+/H+ or K+/H+ antiporter